MKLDSHQWVTLHRVRFPSEISVRDRTFEVPPLPDCWRFCPSQHLDDNDLPTFRSDTWCAFGIYDGRGDAEAMLAAPQKHLQFLSEAIEQWHALLVPIVHRGQVNWRGQVEDGTAIRASSDPLLGPLVVITSAGYNSRTPDQIPRMARFARGIQDVMDFYGALDGNLRRAAFNGGFDSRDGLTVSLWRNDKAMAQAAYGDGMHRAQIDAYRDGSLADRSSFTRARIIISTGSWDGDPLVS